MPSDLPIHQHHNVNIHLPLTCNQATSENVPVATEETVPHVSAMNTEITSILCSILVAPHQ